MDEDKRFDFNPDGKKVILSIDGGGMRGTIVVAMLAELEQALGKPIYDLVDMVGGTSTGAIIAAGIGLHMSAQAMLDQIYKDLLPSAIGNPIIGLIRSGFRYLYQHDHMVKTMGPLATGRKVRDLQNPIVLMTTKDLSTSNTYFIVSKGPGAKLFGDWPVTGAVAASGAAPVYFPAVLNRLIDGGVGVYGNPSLATVTEAMEYIGQDEGFVDGEVIHISLGTGYTPNNAQPEQVRGWRVFKQIDYTITESLEDAITQQVFSTRAIYGKRTDFRRYNPLLTIDNVQKTLGVPTNGIDPQKLGLDSTNPAEIDLMEAIGRAYANKIYWNHSHEMPWNQEGQGQHGGRDRPGYGKPVSWAGSIYDI